MPETENATSMIAIESAIKAQVGRERVIGDESDVLTNVISFGIFPIASFCVLLTMSFSVR